MKVVSKGNPDNQKANERALPDGNNPITCKSPLQEPGVREAHPNNETQSPDEDSDDLYIGDNSSQESYDLMHILMS